MDKTISEIFADFQPSGILTRCAGPDNRVRNITALEYAGREDLVFVGKANLAAEVRRRRPAGVIVTEELAEDLTGDGAWGVLVSTNPKLAHALLRRRYLEPDPHDSEWPRIHPAANVHDSVRVPEDAVLGPGAVIGKDVRLGPGVIIMANSVVEHEAAIGAGTVLHPCVVVGHCCEIGAGVVLKSGCVIGADGFGFVQDDERRNHRIPQLGKVVIEDRVVIGANTTIDRATYHETRISAGCIVDAQCHIGHNVFIDRDAVLVGQTGIAGSAHIGKRVVLAGQSGVLDHVRVTDDTFLVHRAGVGSDIRKPGIYGGAPAHPFKEHLKNITAFKRLGKIWERLRALEKKVEELSR